MSRASLTFLAAALLFAPTAPRTLRAQQAGRGAAAQPAGRTPTIEERTAGMQKLDGYFPLYWDERTGNLWLEITRFNTDFLYTTGLAAGLGSNDIGLDRGSEGAGRLVSFQRVGPRVMMVQPNESFRSSSANAAEQRSVEDSFAKSVLWGFTIGAESNGHVLVDATDFFLRDGQGAGGALGAYRVDRTRSAFYMERTKAFPKNTEIEVTLTFTNEGAGGRGGGGGGPSQGPPAIQVGTPGAGAGRGGRGGGGVGGGGVLGRGGRGRRTVSGNRGQRDAQRRGGHVARALFAGRIARQQLQAAL